MANQKEAKRTISVFAVASFLNDFGSDMIYPIWPFFVTIFLGANQAVLGLIDGLGDAVVSISQAGSGYASDRIRKRKVFVWSGYLFGALSRVGYALSTVWQTLIPFRILDRVGKMRGAPRDAIVADSSTDHNRGRNFGLLRAMDNLGAVFGITVCILFFGFLGYYRLLLLAAVPSIVGASLIFFLIKEKKASNIRLYKGVLIKDLNRDFRLFLALSAIFALGSFSYSFLLLYAGDSGFNETAIPVLYLIFTAVAFLSSLPFGWISDKIGRKSVTALSFLLWGLSSAVLLLARSYFVILLVFVIYGLHRGAFGTVQKAFVCELAPRDFRASSLGGFQLVVGLCALPSSVVAGTLWVLVNDTAPFYFSLVLTMISLVLLVFVKENRCKNQQVADETSASR